MQTGKGRRRITVDLGDSGLYRSLKLAAVDRDLTMREVVVDALEQWLARREAERRFIAPADGAGGADG